MAEFSRPCQATELLRHVKHPKVQFAVFGLGARRIPTTVETDIEALLRKVVPKLKPIMKVKFIIILSVGQITVNIKKKPRARSFQHAGEYTKQRCSFQAPTIRRALWAGSESSIGRFLNFAANGNGDCLGPDHKVSKFSKVELLLPVAFGDRRIRMNFNNDSVSASRNRS